MTYGEKKALGWDETIQACEEGDDRYYLIKSRQDAYKTLEVLADYGADTLTGRGTRVYKVERQSDKNVCVLKDVWVDEDRDPEDVIYENILKSATDPEDRQYLEDHLLKPIDHWAVAVNEGKTEEEDEKDEKDYEEAVLDLSRQLPIRGRTLGFMGPTNRVRLAMYRFLIHP